MALENARELHCHVRTLIYIILYITCLYLLFATMLFLLLKIQGIKLLNNKEIIIEIH